MVNNLTPFTAERAWTRDRDGSEIWLVAVKGTFLIDPDGSTTPDEEAPVDVFMAPEFRDDPETSSLLYDTDLVRTKVATDVILNGHACVPGGEPASQVDVRLRLNNIDKTLRIFGDRVWKKSVGGAKPSAPEPFEKMPITYERAYGGRDETSDNPDQHSWEWRNPCGVGFVTRMEHAVDQPVPNVEDPKDLITAWNSRPEPAGFGPIAAQWAQRAKYAGTYDEAWERDQMPLLPTDLDDRFYQSAPEDQQVPEMLKGGEEVELTNLTPDGHLKFVIPRIRLGFETEFLFDDVQVVHRPVIHTVAIEPDVPRVIVVWHTNLRCHTKVQKLFQTTARVKRRVLARAQEPSGV